MTEPSITRVDPKERANLRARGPYDAVAQLLWEARRHIARATDESRRLPGGRPHVQELLKLQNRLIEAECSVLESSEIRGSLAALEVPEPAQEEPRGPEIPWCSCSMFLAPHLHKDRRPKPDEEPP